MATLRTVLVVLCFSTVLGVAAGSLGTEPLRAARQETVTLAAGAVISLATPPFIQRGKRYAFSWPGGGPPQTFTVRDLRHDGWILVEVAEENVDPAYVPLGSVPTRWLHVALATSVQEMRPLLP